MVGIMILTLAFVLVMVLASGIMMEVTEEWASKLKHKRIFLASLLIALVAAAPEIALAVTAAMQGVPLMSLGSTIGANLANLGLVVGGLVAVVGVVPVVGDYAKSSLWITVSLALLPFMLMSDGNLSRFDGITLIFGYLLYLNYVIKSNWLELKQAKLEKRHYTSKKDIMSKNLASMMLFVIGGALLVVCGVFLVKLVSALSIKLGVSSFWTGLVFLALMTTLPELLVGIWNHSKKESLLTVEKLLGSIVTNSTLVIGVLALIQPVMVGESLSKGLAGLFLVFILGIFWLFTKSKRKLDRWEGIVLVGIYLMFVGLEMLLVR